MVFGCGNFSSIFFPQRIHQLQRGIAATDSSVGNEGMSAYSILDGHDAGNRYCATTDGCSAVLPIFFHIQWVWVLAMPLALIYTAAFYLVVTWLVALRILRRMPEILAVTTRK